MRLLLTSLIQYLLRCTTASLFKMCFEPLYKISSYVFIGLHFDALHTMIRPPREGGAGGPFKPVVGLSGAVPASGGRKSERAINRRGNRFWSQIVTSNAEGTVKITVSIYERLKRDGNWNTVSVALPRLNKKTGQPFLQDDGKRR